MFPVQHVMFRNITEEEYQDMASCKCIRTAEYEKGSILFHAGDRTEEFGILRISICGETVSFCTVFPPMTHLPKRMLSAMFPCWQT